MKVMTCKFSLLQGFLCTETFNACIHKRGGLDKCVCVFTHLSLANTDNFPQAHL